MTNVPIPGRAGTPPPVSKSRQRKSRTRFYLAVATLGLGGIGTVLLALGEPFHLSPEAADSITKSVAALLLTLLLVLPAFAVFQYERASAGGAWHEPSWKPTAMGLLGLLAALLMTMAWHGLRLAFYVARIWTGGL